MIHHLITLSRLILAPFCYFAILSKNFYLAFVLILYAIFSDLSDGFVARLYNSISNFGAVFDVIADKIFIYFVILGWWQISFLEKHKILSAIFMTWIVRDCILSAIYFISKKPFEALMIGKIYTFSQAIMIMLIIIMQINNMAPCNYSQSIILIYFILLASLCIKKYFDILS